MAYLVSPTTSVPPPADFFMPSFPAGAALPPAVDLAQIQPTCQHIFQIGGSSTSLQLGESILHLKGLLYR